MLPKLPDEAAYKKDFPMQPKEREAIIQKIIDESNHESKEAGKHRVLTEWRARLEHEPTLLPLHKIDEIVREVRSRLGKG